MPKRRMCPILSMSGLNLGNVNCKGDKCEFWYARCSRCSIYAIVEGLEGVKQSINDVEEKIVK